MITVVIAAFDGDFGTLFLIVAAIEWLNTFRVRLASNLLLAIAITEYSLIFSLFL